MHTVAHLIKESNLICVRNCQKCTFVTGKNWPWIVISYFDSTTIRQINSVGICKVIGSLNLCVGNSNVCVQCPILTCSDLLELTIYETSQTIGIKPSALNQIFLISLGFWKFGQNMWLVISKECVTPSDYVYSWIGHWEDVHYFTTAK